MSKQASIDAGKRIIILGGGLSGLSFAHYLRNFLSYYKKTDLVKKITILEANDYMGGSVKSNIFNDDSVHELGPRSVRTQGSKAINTVVLVEQLGLSDRVMTITPRSAAGKDRYIYCAGQMWKTPSNFFSVFKKLPNSNIRLIQALKKDVRNPLRMDLTKFPYEDPPLYEFIAHRLGHDAAEQVLDPLLRGITAGDCRNWSTRGIFADLLEKEQHYGGIVKSFSKPPINQLEHDDLYSSDCLQSELLRKINNERVISFNLKSGLQTLPEHISNSLLNTNDDDVVAIYNKTKAMSVEFIDELEEDGGPCSVVVETVDGDLVKIEGDHLIAALPAQDLTTLVTNDKSRLQAGQLEALDYVTKIPGAPVGCVTLEYRDVKLPDSTNSFGFLTHSKSGSRLLGVSFDSASFPDIDKHTGAFRMTCMMGGAWAEQVFGTSDMDKVDKTILEQIALDEIRKILKIEQDPYRISTMLWKRGISQYRPGHVSLLKQTREQIAKIRMPLTLLGQSYDGVAVNDVIYSARLAASKFAQSL